MSEPPSPRPMPVDLSLPSGEDGEPLYDEKSWNELLAWYATELLGLAEVCREQACIRRRHCALVGAPCIARNYPAIEPVMDAAGLLSRARWRFVEEMRAGDGAASGRRGKVAGAKAPRRPRRHRRR